MSTASTSFGMPLHHIPLANAHEFLPTAPTATHSSPRKPPRLAAAGVIRPPATVPSTANRNNPVTLSSSGEPCNSWSIGRHSCRKGRCQLRGVDIANPLARPCGAEPSNRVLRRAVHQLKQTTPLATRRPLTLTHKNEPKIPSMLKGLEHIIFLLLDPHNLCLATGLSRLTVVGTVLPDC